MPPIACSLITLIPLMVLLFSFSSKVSFLFLLFFLGGLAEALGAPKGTGNIVNALADTQQVDQGVQASDGTTNTGATVVEGAAVTGLASAAVAKATGGDATKAGLIGGLFGAVMGAVVDKNNQEQATKEKKIADETADYDAKTAELKDKM